MKKWGFFIGAASLSAAVGISGCGGTGANNVINSGGGRNAGDSVIQVSLPGTAGTINFDYLSGQGRALGDLVAQISKEMVQGNLSDPSTEVDNFTGALPTPIQLLLNGYNYQKIAMSIPMDSSVQSRVFPNFNLILDELRFDNGNGQFVNYPAPGPGQYAARIATFRGRQSDLSVYLNDAIIDLGNDGQTPTLHDGGPNDPNGSGDTLFQAINYDPITHRMNSFLSDYIQFDISHVGSQPALANGGNAQRFYVSGDAYGLTGAGSSGTFEVLTPTAGGAQLGTYAPPTVLTPGFSTYSLVQPDPRDLQNVMKITSLLGIFREYHSVFTGIGNFEFITFPSSNDSKLQELVILVRNGDTITNLYFGNADLTAKTFNAFPVSQVTTAGVAGKISGTLNSLIAVAGTATATPSNVREGRYAISGALPGGFKATGRFVVFRN